VTGWIFDRACYGGVSVEDAMAALLEDHEGGTGKESFHQGWTCGRDRSPDGRVASDRRERRAAMSTNLPKPPCKLIGEDGNVFSIIGRVRRALTAAGQEDRA